MIKGKYIVDYSYFENGNESDDVLNKLYIFDSLQKAINKLKALQDCYLFKAELYSVEKQEYTLLAEITEVEENFYSAIVEVKFYR